jgi:hypothetical protein
MTSSGFNSLSSHKLGHEISGIAHGTRVDYANINYILMNFAIRERNEPEFQDFVAVLGEGDCVGYVPNNIRDTDYFLYDNSMSKQSLAAKPVRMMWEDGQKWLRFGFDLAKDQLTVFYQGIDVAKLKVKENHDIHQNKIVYNATEKVKQQLFYAIQDNEMHIITAQHFRKTKRTELKFGKQKTVYIGKKLTEAGLFPMVLVAKDLPWKLSLDYDQ